MKKYFYLLLALQMTLLADDTLFSGGEMKSGGFGGTSIKIVPINGQATTMIGGGGGWSINDSISISLYGYGNESGKKNSDTIYKNRPNNGFGGFSIGYNLPTKSAFSPSVSILIGAGNTGETFNEFSLINIDAGVQIKLFEWFRISPNIGYSMVNFDTKNHNDSFGGITYGINLMFGKWNK